MHASRLVPLNQEHLIIKLCQLIHQLLNQLQVLKVWPYIEYAYGFLSRGIIFLILFVPTYR